MVVLSPTVCPPLGVAVGPFGKLADGKKLVDGAAEVLGTDDNIDGCGVGNFKSRKGSAALFVSPCCPVGVGGEIARLGALSFELVEERPGKKDVAGPALAGAVETDGAAWGVGSPEALFRNENALGSVCFGGNTDDDAEFVGNALAAAEV